MYYFLYQGLPLDRKAKQTVNFHLNDLLKRSQYVLLIQILYAVPASRISTKTTCNTSALENL